jgi:hypothetical protein
MVRSIMVRAAGIGLADGAGRLDIDDDRVVGVDEVVRGVGKEGVALHRAGPLRRRVGMRGELRLHVARRAEGRVVEHGQIFAHGPRRGIGVDRIRVPILLRRRVLLIGIRLDQAGIDGEVLAADQALGDAPGDHRLEEMPKEVALAKAAMPVLEKVEWSGTRPARSSRQNQR